MKKILNFTVSFIFLLLLSASCGKKKNSNTLTVYLPDSYSWLKETGTCKSFEKKNECKIKFVYFEAAVNIVSRMSLEKSNPKADILMGLSRTTFIRAKKLGVLEKYKPENADKIISGNNIFSGFYATPFDYGGLAIIYNKNKLGGSLNSFNDLTDLRRELVLTDPRTSTTGQDFLLWTIALYGKNWKSFWRKLKPAILTVTKGWNSAFSKLETGEAAAMVSYASDKAYNIYKYHNSRFDVFVPENSGFKQIEGNALVKKQDIKQISKKYIQFMLSDKIQSKIFLHNWMFPVTEVKLPEIAKYYVKPKKYCSISNEEIEKNLTSWLEEWAAIVTK
ncbi:MAG: thiamine ABC transporter substrate-binding protein [Victivallales bacterium]|nr:thiamine ABC transporter substrate-binding protein [Victivallales bacterium]